MEPSTGERRKAAAAELRHHVDEIYARGYVEGRDGARVPLDPHALPQADARDLLTLAVSLGVGRTLEVGLGLGMGTLTLCQALLEVGRPDAGHVVVEGFPDDFGGAGTRTIAEAGVGHLVEQIHEESQLALPRLVGEGRAFDLALIDGDHRFEGVFLDLSFADRLVRSGGLVLIDDAWMPSIRHAVSYFERNMGWKLLPDAMTRAFRWKRPRDLPGRRLRGAGSVAVMRRPAERPARAEWDRFVPFA